ncbi:unnamed protein product [Aphanomyces euteiches]
MAGKDLFSDVPASHWLIEDYYDSDPAAPDKTYAKRGAFLSKVEFDPMEYSIPPNNMPSTDSSQLLALMVAKQVLEDAAQGQFSKMDKERISVILGSAGSTGLTVEMGSRIQRPVWVKSLRESGLPEQQVQEICDRIAAHYPAWNESTFPGLLGNVIAGRIANHYNIGGTNCVVDAACASSLSAVTMGIMELHAGHSDLVITGGIDTLNNIMTYMSFSKTPALSPTGDCRPFSDQADGTMLGEGLCMLAMRRLEDAEKDGDRIYAVLQGYGSSSDGKSKSVYAPVAQGQAKALRRAYDMAGYGPQTVELVEAHGTGTKAGDAAEFNGLTSVFDDGMRADRQWCALGSVKSQVGHTKGAAGAAGLFKAVMALHHKVYPPTIKVDRPNPKLNIESSPFYLNTKTRPWIRGSEHPRRASVSAFGFGGSNFHVTLEEYTGAGNKAWKIRSSPTELIVLCADTPEQLMELCLQMNAELVQSERTLADYARISQEGLAAAKQAKLCIVTADLQELGSQLQFVAPKLKGQVDPASLLRKGIYYAFGASPGKIGMAFPGQGSQYVGMGKDLAIHFDEARAVWDAAASAQAFPVQGKLHDIVFPKPVFTDEELKAQELALRATQWAQPAIGAMSISAWRVLQMAGIEVDMLAGHSYGEITALCAAQSIDEQTMLRIARTRGELMAEAAVAEGAMSAVFHDKELAEWLAVEAARFGVAIANRNSPVQTVISGESAAIIALENMLSEKGVRFQRLPVATAFHSPLVENSVKPFREYLEECTFQPGCMTVLANKDAGAYPDTADAMREQLAQQIARPVLFKEQVEAMYEQGVRTFIEVGPASALTGLVGQCLEGRPHLAVAMDKKGRHGLTSLWHALAQLIVSGVAMDLSAFWTPYAPVAEKKEPAKRGFVLPVSGTNYGKKYPPETGAAGLPKPNPEAVPPVKAEPLPVVFSVPDSANYQTTQKVETTSIPAGYIQDQEVEVFMNNNNQAAKLDLLTIIAELQKQTVEAHLAYQNVMSESHIAFLRTAETTLAGLGSLINGNVPLQSSLASNVSPQRSVLSAPMPTQIPNIMPVAPAPAPAPVPQPAALQPQSIEHVPAVQVMAAAPMPVEMPTYTRMAAPPVSAPPTLAPQVITAPAIQHKTDINQTMLEIVAEKTGYPVEMLDFTTELESGLGIDSIKRVEILSALQERIPRMPEVQPGEMAALNTLGEISSYINKLMNGHGEQSTAAVEAIRAAQFSSAELVATSAETAATDKAESVHTLEQLQQVMLEIVAEKTGYPVEMLDLTTELESGFGIDSIKRVEILSAAQERVPNLPEVQPGEMAVLSTLGEIVDYLNGLLGNVQKKN